MSPEGFTALFVAAGGVVGGIFTGMRSLKSDKFKREVESGAALLSGYTDMVKELRSEIDRLKVQHSAERQEWNHERDRLHEEVDELRSQVYALMHRPSEAKGRIGDQHEQRRD